MPLRQIAGKLTPKGWAMVGGAAAAAIVFLYLVFHLASAPTYTTMLTGLDPAQTGKITSTLDSKGITYQIQNNGTALAVQPSQTAQARIALATAGQLGTGAQQPGFSLFDNQQLGASNFQQQITYQRALEGQLEQTIEQIQGVSGAQVNLVLPNQQDQLFSDNSTPTTASVLLSGSGALDPNSIKGIANLVASSVPGLTADKVTIVDPTGQQVWPTADSTGAAGGSLLAKQDADQRYDAMVAAQVSQMLTQALGPNKAQVQVNANLNDNQSTQDTLTYANKGVPLQQQTQTETLTGGGTGGVAGTTANIAGYAATGGAGTASNYRNTTSNTSYGVDKTVTHSLIAPGNVNDQSVSVLVDKSVPASALPALKAAVAAAVGINPKRGDTISFGQIAFAKPTAVTAGTPSKMMGYAKYALVGLGALIFLVFMGRMLRRREREAITAEPTWLRELEAPRSLAALDRVQVGAPEPPTQVAPLQGPVNVARRQVEDLVDRDADRVAQQVRAWMGVV